MVSNKAQTSPKYHPGASPGPSTLAESSQPPSVALLELCDAPQHLRVVLHYILKRNRRASAFKLQTYTQGLERAVVPDALTVQEATEVFDSWSKDNAILPVRACVKEVYDDVRAQQRPTSCFCRNIESCGNARDFVWKGLRVSDLNVPLWAVYFNSNRL
ncbi:hypothetical protein OG21DRAFT_160409 [Imleria badia]|nr:hypothetical protein OG21DRAFT_160409 [Imleria badia]